MPIEIYHDYTGAAGLRVEDVYSETEHVILGRVSAILKGDGVMRTQVDGVSDESSYTTGALSVVNGGVCVSPSEKATVPKNYCCGKYVDVDNFVGIKMSDPIQLVKMLAGVETVLSSIGAPVVINDVYGHEWDETTSPSNGADHWLTYNRVRVEGPFFVPDTDIPNATLQTGWRLKTSRNPMWDDFTAFTMDAASTPIITPVPNDVDVSPVMVTVTDGGADADSIHYTTDGTAPDENSQQYAVPFVLSAAGPVQVQAINRKDAVNSAPTVVDYLIDAMWYTSDGSDPKTSQTRVAYAGLPISVLQATTMRAVAEKHDFTYSNTASADYMITAPQTVPPAASRAVRSSVPPVSVAGIGHASVAVTAAMFGGMSGENAAAQPLGMTPQKLTGFDTIIPAMIAGGMKPEGVTLRAGLSELVVRHGGLYHVLMSITADTDAAASYEFEVYVNSQRSDVYSIIDLSDTIGVEIHRIDSQMRLEPGDLVTVWGKASADSQQFEMMAGELYLNLTR